MYGAEMGAINESKFHEPDRSGEMEKALEFHESHKGKIKIESKIRLESKEELSLAYTPGSAFAANQIRSNNEDVYRYTLKGNMVAIISDGSSVLSLGDIGPLAAIPVIEAKAMLCKVFGGVNAFPICLDTKDTEDIINTIKNMAPVFGGIILEDISAPKCFEIEDRLKKLLDIPVFHDDQHATASVVLAALINSLKITGKKFNEIKVVFSGAGASGIATAKLLMKEGVRDIILCDSRGIIYEGRDGLNPYKEEIAQITNKNNVTGTLADAIKDADVFIGLSAGNIVSQDMVRSMADDSLVFPLANPTSEIRPEKAKQAGALIVGTARSDFPNQINNALCYPGLFRGVLDVRARDINDGMKMAAANAMASLVQEPTEEKIIPGFFDPDVASSIASAVAKAAIESGVARLHIDPEEVAEHTRELCKK